MLVDPFHTSESILAVQFGDMERFWVHWGPDVGDVRLVARGRRSPPDRMTFIAEQRGAPPTDFVFAGGLPTLLTERARAALSSAAISGWSSCACELELRDGKTLPMHFLIIHGRSGGLDYREARRIEVPSRRPGCPPVGHNVGYKPDMSRWDGSDLFIVGDTDLVCATVAAARRLADATLTGVRFTEVDVPDPDHRGTRLGRPPSWSGE